MPRKKRAREELHRENTDCLPPNSTTQGLTSDTAHNTTMDERLKSHDLFFNNLLDTIPESLLLPSYDEANGELIAARFMKNKAGASPHQKRKEDSKRSKKARYENENVQASILDRQMAAAVTQETKESDDDGEKEDLGKRGLLPAHETLKVNATLANSDELRERIKKRIAELRSSRGGTAKEGGRRKKGGNKVNREDRNIHQGNDKTTTTTTTPSKKGVATTASSEFLTPCVSSINGGKKNTGSGPLSTMNNSTNSISFGTIRIGDGLTGKKRKMKIGRPGSKLSQLRSLLDSAEKKSKRLEELKKTKEGRDRIVEEGMKDAIKAASSVKGHGDDVTAGKVRKAIKRREKSKAKSSKQWKERESKVKNMKLAYQAKREKNLHQRGKRGRAGFEGKKTDFIQLKQNEQ